MPTIFSHAAFSFGSSRLALGTASPNSSVLTAAAVLAALPDADALFIAWIPYEHPLGHRGLTHSLLFAAVAGTAAAFLLARYRWAEGIAVGKLALVFSLTMASHGVFDAMTNGGLGIAFFAPFDNTRYFFPWRPIPVAPLSLHGLANTRGLRLLLWEAGMFGTFAAGAILWAGRPVWRPILAIGCWLITLVVWVAALATVR